MNKNDLRKSLIEPSLRSTMTTSSLRSTQMMAKDSDKWQRYKTFVHSPTLA